MYSRLMLAAVLSSSACSRAHVAAASPDGGQDGAVNLPLQQANAIADHLELAYERYFACRELPGDSDVWDGFDRECFIAFITKHLERQDGLAACVRDLVLASSQCGEATPCSSPVCSSATLLDDDPVLELVKEDCGAHVDAQTRDELRACR